MIEIVEESQEGMSENPRIVVVGIGGAGVNAVDNMSAHGLSYVEYLAMNTDSQALSLSRCPNKLLIGRNVTRNLGTGANPFLGEQAALEDRDAIRDRLEGADLVFITAGLGGGTGTGASPVVADIAKEVGALTVAITTKPFDFEGPQRRRHADNGQVELRKRVETLITIPNQRLLKIVDERVPLLEAFKVADSVLMQCVQSISDLITQPGQINLDFADIKTIMENTGGAVMGVGFGRGEEKTRAAFSQACSSPLMEEMVLEGAKGILVHVTAGYDVTLYEINACMEEFINSKVDDDANIIFGVVLREDMKEEAKVTILATVGTAEPRRQQAVKGRAAAVASPSAGRTEPVGVNRRQMSYEEPAYLSKPGGGILNKEQEAPRGAASAPTPTSGGSSEKNTEQSQKRSGSSEGRTIPQIFGFK